MTRPVGMEEDQAIDGGVINHTIVTEGGFRTWLCPSVEALGVLRIQFDPRDGHSAKEQQLTA